MRRDPEDLVRRLVFAGFAFEIPNRRLPDVRRRHVVRAGDARRRWRDRRSACAGTAARGCAARIGHLDKIVCPCHSWTYSLTGALVNGMHEGIDESKFGLKRVHTEVVAGLIYISLPTHRRPSRGCAPSSSPPHSRRDSIARGSPK
jgi:phenylpropionate dioxygenase-like ring-hydroxylating dioxygenase large terminal subunit